MNVKRINNEAHVFGSHVYIILQYCTEGKTVVWNKFMKQVNITALYTILFKRPILLTTFAVFISWCQTFYIKSNKLLRENFFLEFKLYTRAN